MSTSPDRYAYWLAAMRGQPLPPIHESEPGAGYYRIKRKSGELVGCAIWYDSIGNPLAIIGSQKADPHEAWIWAAKHPVSQEWWQTWKDTGRWPDDAPEARALSNLPSDPFEALTLEIEAEAEEVERWLAGDPIRDKTSADRCANWAERVAALEKRADEARIAEKRPHDEAARAVQAKWRPLVERAEALKTRLKAALTPFLKAEARKLAEERAARARNGDAPPERARGAHAGSAGRKVALKTRRVAVIVDIDAVLSFFRDNRELRECAEKLCQRAVTAGATPPGVRVDTEEQAA